MADFVAVLRKTIGTLGDNSPEMREKVYEKARATIEAKLAAIDPPPPAAVVDRQRKALEDAIAVVRADHDEPAAAEKDDDLEDVFATLKSMGDIGAGSSPSAPIPPRAQPAGREPARPAPATVAAPAQPRPAPAQEPPVPSRDPVLDVDDDDVPAPAAAWQHEPKGRRSAGGRTGMIAALAVLLVVAIGGYALWMNQDALFGDTPPASPVAEAVSDDEDGVSTAEELVETPAAEEEAETAAGEPAGQAPQEAGEEDVAAAPVAQEEPSAPAGQDAAPADAPAEDAPKFTQRLLPDGSEIDEGPAGEPGTIGEGTSVASAAQTPQQPADEAQPEAGAAEDGAEEEAAPAVAVGQRAIFYEERTSNEQGSAETGSIVWSLVQEPPGGDLPPEPAIRAEATVPGKDVQLRMTIRRNGDQTLPASHIVEMIFLTPEGFEGGAIANVSRISFKETEQAAGAPLRGIPAKIADGFFLIALGDTPAEIEANMNLLRQQDWIDIPIVYQTGRRALLSLEKGIPGDRVFDEALRAWAESTSG